MVKNSTVFGLRNIMIDDEGNGNKYRISEAGPGMTRKDFCELGVVMVVCGAMAVIPWTAVRHSDVIFMRYVLFSIYRGMFHPP